jgi:hypothetical protein
MCGLLGLVGALMVEVSLFLVREQKAALETEQQKKILGAAKTQEQVWEQAQEKTGKKQQELERRRQTLEQQQAAGTTADSTDEIKLD